MKKTIYTLLGLLLAAGLTSSLMLRGRSRA